jgi:hypothetical protein
MAGPAPVRIELSASRLGAFAAANEAITTKAFEPIS